MLSFSGFFAALLPAPVSAQGPICRLTPAKQAPQATWLQSSALATLTVGLQQEGRIFLQAGSCRSGQKLMCGLCGGQNPSAADHSWECAWQGAFAGPATTGVQRNYLQLLVAGDNWCRLGHGLLSCEQQCR